MKTGVEIGSCGPGRLGAMTPGFGPALSTVALVSTGNSFSNINGSGGVLYAAGDWKISVWMRKTGLNATVTYSTTLADASCVGDPGNLGSGSFSVTSTSWVKFEETTVRGNLFVPDNFVIFTVLKETVGDAELEWNQPTPNFFNRWSRYYVPDVIDVRPHEYYKRQRRRRSC